VDEILYREIISKPDLMFCGFVLEKTGLL